MKIKCKILLIVAATATSLTAAAATVGYWRMEGDATGFLSDSGPNGLTLANNGNVNGVTAQIANPGFGATVPQTGAANLNSANLSLANANFFSRADNALFTPGTAFTIEAYLSLASSQAGANVARNIVGHWNDGSALRSWRLIATGETSGLGARNLVFQGSSAGSAAVNFDSNFQFTLGNNYYVGASAVQNAGNYDVTFYFRDLTLNTPLQTTTVSAALSGFFDTTTAFRIGAGGGAAEVGIGWWDGAIDEVRLSDTALTPAQLLVTSVPEPSAMTLGFLGACALAWRQRQARRSPAH